MIHCIDLILMAKRRIADPLATAAELKLAAKKHLELHIRAHGTGHIKPKHHWQLDMPDQLARDGAVIDALVIERIHLQVKAVAEPVTNLRTFEATVLGGVVVRSVEVRREFRGRSCLRGRVERHGRAKLGSHLTVEAAHFSIGDIVFRGESAGVVEFCIEEDDEFALVVRRFGAGDQLTDHATRWAGRGGQEVWFAAHAELAVAWFTDGVGSTTVLRM